MLGMARKVEGRGRGWKAGEAMETVKGKRRELRGSKDWEATWRREEGIGYRIVEGEWHVLSLRSGLALVLALRGSPRTGRALDVENSAIVDGVCVLFCFCLWSWLRGWSENRPAALWRGARLEGRRAERDGKLCIRDERGRGVKRREQEVHMDGIAMRTVSSGG